MARSKGMDLAFKPHEPSSGPGLQNCSLWLAGRGYFADDPSLYDDICRVSSATYSAEWGNFGALPTNLQLVWVLTNVDSIKRKISAIAVKPALLPLDDSRLNSLSPCQFVNWPAVGAAQPQEH
jgi:hypothetical protein